MDLLMGAGGKDGERQPLHVHAHVLYIHVHE